MTWRAVWDIRPVTGRGISPTFMASPFVHCRAEGTELAGGILEVTLKCCGDSYNTYPLVNSHIAMENHHFQWENPLFLWPCSIAMLVHQRVLHDLSSTKRVIIVTHSVFLFDLFLLRGKHFVTHKGHHRDMNALL